MLIVKKNFILSSLMTVFVCLKTRGLENVDKSVAFYAFRHFPFQEAF
jgi:hypothetical protein